MSKPAVYSISSPKKRVVKRQEIFQAASSEDFKLREKTDEEALDVIYSAIDTFLAQDSRSRFQFRSLNANAQAFGHVTANLEGHMRTIPVHQTISHSGQSNENRVESSSTVVRLDETQDAYLIGKNMRSLFSESLGGANSHKKDLVYSHVVSVLANYEDANEDGDTPFFTRLWASFFGASAGAAGENPNLFLSDILPGPLNATANGDWQEAANTHSYAKWMGLQVNVHNESNRTILPLHSWPAELIQNTDIDNPASWGLHNNVAQANPRLRNAVFALARVCKARCGFDANYAHTNKACGYVKPFEAINQLLLFQTNPELIKYVSNPNVRGAAFHPEDGVTNAAIGANDGCTPQAFQDAIGLFLYITGSAESCAAGFMEAVRLGFSFHGINTHSMSVPLSTRFNLPALAAETILFKRLSFMYTRNFRMQGYEDRDNHRQIAAQHGQWSSHPIVGYKGDGRLANTNVWAGNRRNDLLDRAFGRHDGAVAPANVLMAGLGNDITGFYPPDNTVLNNSNRTTRMTYVGPNNEGHQAPAGPGEDAFEQDNIWYHKFLSLATETVDDVEKICASLDDNTAETLMAWLNDDQWIVRWNRVAPAAAFVDQNIANFVAQFGVAHTNIMLPDNGANRAGRDYFTNKLAYDPAFVHTVTGFKESHIKQHAAGFDGMRRYITTTNKESLPKKASTLAQVLWRTNVDRTKAAGMAIALQLRAAADIAVVHSGLNFATLGLTDNTINFGSAELNDIIRKTGLGKSTISLKDKITTFVGLYQGAVESAGLYDRTFTDFEDGIMRLTVPSRWKDVKKYNREAFIQLRAYHPLFVEFLMPKAIVGGGLLAGKSEWYFRTLDEVQALAEIFEVADGKTMKHNEVRGALSALAFIAGYSYQQKTQILLQRYGSDSGYDAYEINEFYNTVQLRISGATPQAEYAAVPTQWVCSYPFNVEHSERRDTHAILPAIDYGKYTTSAGDCMGVHFNPFNGDKTRNGLSPYESEEAQERNGQPLYKDVDEFRWKASGGADYWRTNAEMNDCDMGMDENDHGEMGNLSGKQNVIRTRPYFNRPTNANDMMIENTEVFCHNVQLADTNRDGTHNPAGQARTFGVYRAHPNTAENNANKAWKVNAGGFMHDGVQYKNIMVPTNLISLRGTLIYSPIPNYQNLQSSLASAKGPCVGGVAIFSWLSTRIRERMYALTDDYKFEFHPLLGLREFDVDQFEIAEEVRDTQKAPETVTCAYENNAEMFPLLVKTPVKKGAITTLKRKRKPDTINVENGSDTKETKKPTNTGESEDARKETPIEKNGDTSGTIKNTLEAGGKPDPSSKDEGSA